MRAREGEGGREGERARAGGLWGLLWGAGYDGITYWLGTAGGLVSYAVVLGAESFCPVQVMITSLSVQILMRKTHSVLFQLVGPESVRETEHPTCMTSFVPS